MYTGIFSTNRFFGRGRQFVLLSSDTLKEMMEEVNRQVTNANFHQGYIWKGKSGLEKAPKYLLLPKFPFKRSYTETESGMQVISSESPPGIIYRKTRGKCDEEDAVIFMHDFADAYKTFLELGVEHWNGVKIIPRKKNEETA